MTSPARCAVVVTAALLAACSDAPKSSARDTAEPAAVPATVVGEVGTTVRVALPHLTPQGFAEIATREIREPAETGGARSQIDSTCEIWGAPRALVGSICGWTISGESSAMESANLRATVKATAIDGRHVRYEVEASLR